MLPVASRDRSGAQMRNTLASVQKRMVIPRSGIKPEAPTTSAPLSIIHRAMERAKAQRRSQDRGGMTPIRGMIAILKDGTRAGAPKPIPPRNLRLGAAIRQVVNTAANRPARLQALKALERSSFGVLNRRRRYIVTMKSRVDPVQIAQRKRPKPNAPGKVEGYRPESELARGKHRGFLHFGRISPASVRDAFIAKKIGGTALAMAPIGGQPAPLPAPELSVDAALARGIVIKSSSVDRVNAPGGTAAVGVGERSERILLLGAVAVLGFMMLSRR
jgi:hypothetical protein